MIRWIWIPVAVAAAVILLILGKRKQGFVEAVNGEINVIEAKSEARRLKAAKGIQGATLEIEERYRHRMEKLDSEQTKKADRLRGDPVALAAFLERLGE